jgi:hypothetical protein
MSGLSDSFSEPESMRNALCDPEQEFKKKKQKENNKDFQNIFISRLR